VIESMGSFTLSLIVGFLLGYSSVWLVSRINDRYAQWEENFSRVLLKRGKKDLGRAPDLNRVIAVWQTAKSWILPIYGIYLRFLPKSFLQKRQSQQEAHSMTAYEFYWEDQEGREHFLGILPERRKNRERITEESVRNWGRMVIGDWATSNNFYFIQVEVQ